MKIGVPRQNGSGETRVALVPAVAKRLIGAGAQVVVESNAGLGSGASDQAYIDAGATVTPSDGEATAAVWSEVDAVLTVAPPSVAQVRAMREGSLLIGMLAPLTNREMIAALRDRRVTSFAMEFIPRISRAQSMDALSSQANIGGYKAVLLGANHCPKMFPMMITAAGTLPPARVFVIGAGVAGLQAIATAKRLGAVVEAYDVRPVTKEQVQSLGGRFVELPTAANNGEAAGGYAREQTADEQQQQADLMAKHVISADVVITTAAIFGKAPPMLVPASVVEQMMPGSAIVDMAADAHAGRGNCELTRPGETYTTANGVTLIGALNLPALVPAHASLAFANNMHALLKELLADGSVKLNLDDEIQKGACITHAGEIRNELVKQAVQR